MQFQIKMAGAVTKDETFGALGHIENTEKKYLTVEKTEFEGKTQKNILCSTNIHSSLYYLRKYGGWFRYFVNLIKWFQIVSTSRRKQLK